MIQKPIDPTADGNTIPQFMWGLDWLVMDYFGPCETARGRIDTYRFRKVQWTPVTNLTEEEATLMSEADKMALLRTVCTVHGWGPVVLVKGQRVHLWEEAS